MKKKNILKVLMLLIFADLFASPKVLCSTVWIASFAQIAGAENIEFIVPETLQHPPEYELKLSDIKKINDCDYFIYAGFDRMSNLISESKNFDFIPIKIDCKNSFEVIYSQTNKIADVLGTKSKWEKNIKEVEVFFLNAKKLISEKSLDQKKIACNFNQLAFAKSLGLNVISSLGPNELSFGELLEIEKGKWDFVIDNIHNPIVKKDWEIAPESKIVIWRNFPTQLEEKTLIRMLESNLEKLLVFQ